MNNLKKYYVLNPRFNPFSGLKLEWDKELIAYGKDKESALEAIKAFYPELELKDLKEDKQL